VTDRERYDRPAKEWFMREMIDWHWKHNKKRIKRTTTALVVTSTASFLWLSVLTILFRKSQR